MNVKYQQCIEDMEIAKEALEHSKIYDIVGNRPLLCEVYSCASLHYQTVFFQVFGGDDYLILFAKPLISDYWGHHTVAATFAQALEADEHVACKGDIYCGIKYTPVNDIFVTTLLSCLPEHREIVTTENVILLDGCEMLLRNNQTLQPTDLYYMLATGIADNKYSDEELSFLDMLGEYIDGFFGNLIDSSKMRGPNDKFWEWLQRERKIKEAR